MRRASRSRMPRTFLVERIVDMSSSVKDTGTKFKVTDDVTLDGGSDARRCDEMQQTHQQKVMTSDQQREVATETSVIDYCGRPAIKLGTS